jgi:uncharacterized surface protein with fasciclin (FAS1) repeats
MKTITRNQLTALSLTIAVAITAAPALAGSCQSSSQAKASEAHATHAVATTDVPAIYDLAGEAGFTTLVAAIDAAGLAATLNGEGPYTVFAPTNAAFAKLPEGTLTMLLNDKEALTRVLLYHVTAGAVYAEDVVDLRAAKTLNGQKVKIDASEGVMINDATVVQADVRAQNGVIHVIDTVLIPENL